MIEDRYAIGGAHAGRTARRGAWLLLGCLTLAVILGLVQGQDANWDLRNYHLYDAHALLRGRLDLDVAPAQVQTWLSPFWDCLYYPLAVSGLDSRVTTALLALPAGVALFLLVLLARQLAPAHARGWIVAVLLAVAATGAAGLRAIGTTMSDWHTVALVIGAVLLALRAREPGQRRWHLHALAGLCAGAAVGLKLTAVPYALGLAVMIAALPGGWRGRLASLGALAIGGVLGFAVLYGPWAFLLWHRYGNPFFPFFNQVFHAPSVPPSSFRDERFLATSLGEVLALPLRLVSTTTLLVAEVPLRDPRLALGFPALGWLAFGSRAGAARPAWRGLLALYTVAYALWAVGFGILRYAVFLELLASVAVVIAGTLLAGARRPVAVLAIAALVIGWTRWPEWGRRRHGVQAVRVELPPVPADALVVLATGEPLGYAVAALPPTVPAVSILNNFLDPIGRPSPMDRQVLARIRGHAGPVLLLGKRSAPEERFGAVRVFDLLATLGLAPDMAACAPVRTAMEDGVVLCPLGRAAPQVEPASLERPERR